MYIYTHAYTYIHACVYTHICIYISIYIYMYMSTCTHRYVYIYDAYVRINTYHVYMRRVAHLFANQPIVV